jgi:hypothetical protein
LIQEEEVGKVGRKTENFIAFIVIVIITLLWLLVAANVPISPILVTLVMEAIRFSETSFLTRPTRRNIPEDGILHSHCRENLKPYIALTGWSL